MLLPSTGYTWSEKGGDSVKGIKGKRQFTLTPAISAAGVLVAMQLIFKGKTTACEPSAEFRTRFFAERDHRVCDPVPGLKTQFHWLRTRVTAVPYPFLIIFHRAPLGPFTPTSDIQSALQPQPTKFRPLIEQGPFSGSISSKTAQPSDTHHVADGFVLRFAVSVRGSL
jgi:hypothetical protein